MGIEGRYLEGGKVMQGGFYHYFVCGRNSGDKNEEYES